MKKEIEVKARVTNKEVIISRLSAWECVLSEPIEQHDTIYVNFDSDYTTYMPGTNFLRIRKTPTKTYFTLKQPQTNELDNIEKEVEISDAGTFAEALQLMGYHEVIRVHKVRRKTQYRDMEICLDEVDGLGTFIEIEMMSDEDAEYVQEKLFEVLQLLGVSREDQVFQGYDTLAYIQQKNF